MRLLTVALALLWAAFVLSGCPKKPAETGAGEVGTAETQTRETAGSTIPSAGGKWTGDAKDFTFTTVDGQSRKLSDYAGKPLVLNFWATWCGPCVGEFPEFQAAWAGSSGRYEMVSITNSSSEDPKGFVAQNGYTWTFGVSEEATAAYNIEAIPATFFIDANGSIKTKAVGAIDKATFEKNLSTIL